MDLVQQVEHLQALFLELAAIARTAFPVCHHMQNDFRLGTILHAVYQRIPLDGTELDKHGRTLPVLLLLDKFDIVIP